MEIRLTRPNLFLFSCAVFFPFALLALMLSNSQTAAAQDPGQNLGAPPRASSQAQPPRAAIPIDTTEEKGAKTLKVKVDLILVPVVVRDSSGHAVGSLQKQDFQLFDNHKIQEVAQFAVENTDRTATDLPGNVSAAAASPPGKLKKFVAPARFTAILFDDVHSTFDNLPQLQSASLHLVSNALAPAERLGIFTTSGKVIVDFTDDRATLQDALKKLKPNPLPGSQTKECADLSHYDANQIVNRHDLVTRDAAVSQTMEQCGIKDPKMALAMVLETSERVLRIGDVQTQLVLQALAGAIDRLSALPGQRTLIFASPSFLVSDREHREYELVDRAIRSHIVISTLDTRGLYTEENEVADSNVLSTFAYGTGGTFFHNSNDLTEGLRRLASPPEFVYQLGFYPKDLAENGKYHHLQVKLAGGGKFTISAREGYFAPTHIADPAKAESSEINEVLFSQSEIHDLPIQMQTQFVKGDKAVAKLNVLTFVDLSNLPHRQTGDQNANQLRMIAAVFDRNGKYLGAIDRKIDVHWTDSKAGTQTATTFSFLLDPGAYVVRLVVRDSESQHLSTQDTLVEIP